MTIHFSGTCLILIGSGIVAFIVGGTMTMTFDISNWMPSVGGVLAVLGICAAVIGIGMQIGAWAGVT
jgi:hypothetical protein